nr:hypothetical protein BaRGS_013194 [Batillaria attramentaria]
MSMSKTDVQNLADKKEIRENLTSDHDNMFITGIIIVVVVVVVIIIVVAAAAVVIVVVVVIIIIVVVVVVIIVVIVVVVVPFTSSKKMVLLGVGFGLVFSPSVVILSRHFKRRLGLANGIVVSGAAVLTVAYALFLPELFKVQDLQLTLLCVSGAVFLFLPCAFAFKPAVHELGVVKHSEGAMYDHLGSYTAAFHASGAFLLASAVILFLAFPRETKGQL